MSNQALSKKIAAGGFAVLAVCMVASGILLGMHAWSPTPVYDQWQEIAPEQLADLFKPHNEHRIAVTRVIAWMDLALARGTGVVSLAFVYAFSAGHSALLWFLMRLTWPQATPGQLSVLTALIAVLFFSGSQYENFASGFQNQFTGVFFFATLAIVLLCLASVQTTWLRKALVSASMAAAAAGCVTMANGLLIAPLLALIAFLLRLRVTAWLMAGLAITTSFLYSVGLPAHPSSSESAPWVIFSPIAFFGNASAYLGAAFANSVAVVNAAVGSRLALAQLFGVGLIFGVLVLLARAMRAPPDRRHLFFAWSGICLFVLASAVVTALGRSEVASDAMLTSRYGAGAAAVWSVVLINLTMSAQGRLRRTSLAVVGLICIWLGSVQLFWTGATQGYKIRRIDAEEALLVNVHAEAALLAVYPSATKSMEIAELLRSRGLAMYYEAWRQLYGRVISQASERCISSADVPDAVPFASSTAFVWRASVVDGDMPEGTRALAATNEAGVVVGLLIRGGRDDVNATLFGSDDAPPRWSGYIHLDELGINTLDLQAVDALGDATCRFEQRMHLIKPNR